MANYPKNRNSKPRKTLIDFLKDAKFIHGEVYDYSLVEYKYAKDKIKIICKEHGVFEQRAADHIRGIGCSICKNRDKLKINKLTNEEFINRANIAHNNLYDYSKVNYINDNVKVCILCKKHGEFLQLPGCHVRFKHGCPKCRSSKGEQEILNFLNVNNISFEREKTFSNLLLKRKLKFDFYLPALNIIIEYDGIQHFSPVRFNGISQEMADKLFERTKIVDSIKTDFCLNNNIKLLRISYNENIQLKLKDYLW